MKKPWLLIIAGVLLTTLIGMWLYLFFGGDEAREDLYNAFGLQGDELPFGIEDIFGEDNATSSVPYLRQISFRQVIGYIPFAASSTTSPYVYIAEAGTGHIYKVDTVSGDEERLSNITIPTASKAVFSPNGQYVAVVPNDSRATTVLSLPNGTSTVTSTDIEARVADISFTNENILVYSEKSNQSTVGFSYNPATGETATIFTIPFREAVVAFGETVEGPHYTYPKMAEELEGYVYAVTGSSLKRLPITGFGLSVQNSPTWMVFTRIENNQPTTYLFEKETENNSTLDISVFPEKCASAEGEFICAINESSANSQTSWYRGEYVSSDSLWYILPDINYVGRIEDISQTAGQPLDVTEPELTTYGFYFITKQNDSLWVYDRDFTSSLTDN